MASWRVVLMEPLYGGNVGSVARAMANFGLECLVLVNGPPVGDETRMFAVHALPIVERATRCATLDEAVAGAALVAGFSAVIAHGPGDHHRTALSLDGLAARLADVGGEVALVFGREDKGLSNEELEACDVVVQIPTSPAYPSMNLSHAVAVALYALSKNETWAPLRPLLAGHDDIDRLVLHTSHLLRVRGVPEYRVRATANATRRLVARAPMTTWEHHRWMGVLSTALKAMGAWPVPAPGPADTRETPAP